MDKIISRTRLVLLLAASLVLCLVVVPVEGAPAADSTRPQANASVSVKKQVKRLKKQVKDLRVDVEVLSKQPGPQGPPGEQGEQGPPGSLGPAGGDLAGDYPNPSIASGAITTEALANGAATNPKLANNAVTASKVADDSITGSDIFNFSIGLIDLAGNSVNSAKVSDNTLTGADINESSLDLNITDALGFSDGSPDSPKSATATCPAGSQAISAGYQFMGGGVGFPPNGETRVAVTRLVVLPARQVGVTAEEVAGGPPGSWSVVARATCAQLAG